MKKPRFRTRPEQLIQDKFIKFVRLRGWHVERMIGNAHQKGIPDLYLFHREHGHRWVDIKNPVRHTLTKAQCQKWPVWESKGIDIHIIVGASEDEYRKLFDPANWRMFWRPAYNKYVLDISEIIEDLS